MYEVKGRERVRGERLGRYVVEFSCRWPSEVGHLYLVSSFTSFFPGRVELTREGQRGRAVVKLWEGVYPYRFASTCGVSFPDEENPLRTTVRLWPDMDYTEEFSLAAVGVQELLRASREGELSPDVVVHDERDPAFISYYLGHTVVRLKAPRGVLTRVFIETRGGTAAPMERFCSNEWVDVFQGMVVGRIEPYRFVLEADGEKVLFGDNGLGDEEYISPERVVGVDEPRWYLGATYYLVFPDSFTRSSGILERRPRSRLGGRLKDITSGLDHVASLGVDAIYLTPIYRASSYHRYDVADHTAIDESLGGWEDWFELVREAGGRGIRLVLDIVAHHASPCSREFSEALLNPASPYRSWFRFFREPCESEVEALRRYVSEGCRELPRELWGRRPFYEAFMCNWLMPKLNYSNPEVVERLLGIAAFWLERGAGGFRVDVGHAIPDHVLRAFYEKVKEVCRDCVVVLEITKGAGLYPLGIVADSAMNYDLRALLLEFLVYGTIDAAQFVERVKELYASMPVHVAHSMYNLLGSHDTPRIATLCEKCGARCLRALYVALFATPGSPSIYYGDEVGMRGGGDPDNRLPMVWNEEVWDKELLSLIRRLSALRRRLKPLRLGFFDAEPIGGEAVKLTRWWEGEEVVVLLSRGPAGAELPKEYLDVESGKLVGEVALEPYSWRILYSRKS
uniref:Glycoside hydrolase family 13 protein n=1 Tax=Thermofilum pendens TaxID=2269 RepID=A0A7J3X766_THEPE